MIKKIETSGDKHEVELCVLVLRSVLGRSLAGHALKTPSQSNPMLRGEAAAGGHRIPQSQAARMTIPWRMFPAFSHGERNGTAKRAFFDPECQYLGRNAGFRGDGLCSCVAGRL